MFSYLDLILAMGFAWMIYGIIVILIFGLALFDNFIKPYMLPSPVIKVIYFFTRNIYFLIGPALWLYTRSLLQQQEIKKIYLLIHLIPNYTILAIAFECGFKSTSAFYTLFKKKTGQTPKEFIAAEGINR